MKKILDAGQIKQADAYTIEHEPVSSLLLMERAAYACFQWLLNNYSYSGSYKIFCGLGNNGGDGLVIADYLLTQNFDTKVYIIRYADNHSYEFSENEQRLISNFPKAVFNVFSENDFPELDKNDLIIDAIFGTGLNHPPDGLVLKTINHINNACAEVIAIDMPSGLFADKSSLLHAEAIIRARHTLTFQFRKLSHYFAGSFNYCGDVHVIDIKLHLHFVNSCVTNHFETEIDDIIEIVKPRKLFSHKGNYGHALLMCGSYGKTGAAVLSAQSCLRSGVGLLTVNVPQCGYNILQTAVPEAMVIADNQQDYIAHEIDYNSYNAIGIGCGLGNNVGTIKLLKHFLSIYQKPIVIDADALNILAHHKELLCLIPHGSILTPHLKEFSRLTKNTDDDFERNELQRQFSIDFNCYIILKGKFSAITTPDNNCYFNPTGNAGMATAGSGDVLTGILTGLLAQGYSPLEVCIAGTYLHGAAGDHAVTDIGMPSLIASDITKYLSNAYLSLTR